MRIKLIFVIVLILCTLCHSEKVKVKQLPQLQKEFLDLKFGMFLHFNLATYHNVDWALGTEDPLTFKPSALDCNQWAHVAKDANVGYAVLTVKHTEGFALWPSKYTAYNIQAARNFREGNGDLVKEFTDAFRKQNIKVGFYYCFPNNFGSDLHGLPIEAQTDYVTFIKNQLTELLTSYGDIVLIWCDQYSNKYTGSRWKEIYQHIKTLQPNCLVIANNSLDFSETDILSYEYPWLLASGKQPYPLAGNKDAAEVCDCSENAWFWKRNCMLNESIDIKKERLQMLTQRNSNYLLNTGPDTTGLIRSETANLFKEIGKTLK